MHLHVRHTEMVSATTRALPRRRGVAGLVSAAVAVGWIEVVGTGTPVLLAPFATVLCLIDAAVEIDAVPTVSAAAAAAAAAAGIIASTNAAARVAAALRKLSGVARVFFLDALGAAADDDDDGGADDANTSFEVLAAADEACCNSNTGGLAKVPVPIVRGHTRA